jgi:SsrA-binding protein
LRSGKPTRKLMSTKPKIVAKKATAQKIAPEPRVDNRRARFEFELLERLEAGIVLTGTEIKSIRTGQITLAQAYARIRDGEIWLIGMHIPAYKEGSFSNHEPLRARKLLLHRKELDRLTGRTAEKGLTLVPISLYFKRGRVKVEIALARGKKLWDKRQQEKNRDVQRDMARAVRT